MAEPLRVAQVLNRMDSGGIEAVVINYYRHIDRDRVQFDFYFAADSHMPRRAELEHLGAGLYPLPPYSRPLACHRALYKAFKAHGYRIVHAHMSTMSLFPLFAAWRAGVPVRICHNHSTAHWSEGSRTLLKYILRPFNKLFATDWFACGERAGRWMYGDRAFEAGRVTVMPNAIETARFAFDPAARQCLRAEMGIAMDAFVVGHVGRFMYQKNHAFLVEAFRVLAARRPDAVLLLVGERELEAQVRRQVQDLGLTRKVIFAGVRADVDKLYSAMDVFCLPSYYEGMPVVVWEAQANGLPCVLSDCVTREAACGGNCVFKSLQAGPAAWAEEMELARRQKDVTVPDIGPAAEQMMEFYLKKQEAAS